MALRLVSRSVLRERIARRFLKLPEDSVQRFVDRELPEVDDPDPKRGNNLHFLLAYPSKSFPSKGCASLLMRR